MRQAPSSTASAAVAVERGETNEELHAALAAAELARQRAEASEARFRQSEEREHFLAEASRMLGSSIDFETTIQKVAMLAVPRLADWCGVDLLDDHGDLHQIAVAHVDPAKVEWARQLRKHFPPDPADAPTGVRAVIRTGKSEFYPDITDEMIEASARDEAHLALLRELDLHGVIIAPLTAGDRTLGALSLISSRGSRRYTEADVGLAEELAHRAALSIQSSRLYTAEQEARLRAEDVAERSKRLQAVTAGLSQAATPVAVADAALGDSIAALGASNGALFAVGAEGKSLELIKSVGLDERNLKDFRTIPMDAPLPLSDAVRERTAVYIESREEMLERYPLLRDVTRSATTAWAMTPLAVGERVVGGMVWGFGTQRVFDDADRAFIDSVARQCALAVERAQLYAAERTARESAQAANRAKSDFLATMSHELRTPINAIQGYAQLLDLGIPGPVTSQQREYLNRVTSSAQHLLGLVNEVLDLAKIESGTITVENEAIIAADTVGAALSLIRPQAASKELSLSEECEGARETPYLGDEHRVRQILTNLLSNAVKFTAPGGRITVGCAVTEDAPATVKDGRDGPFVVFRIEDTGSGIEPDQIERIFDPFTQAETVHKNPYTRGAGGTGLGLTISRRLARLMGGELTVKSTPGMGSEFSLWMPMSERRKVERPDDQLDAGHADAAPADDADGVASGLARIAEGLLRETGFLVSEYVRRVRAHPDISMAAGASDTQIEDHTATFIADVAIGLRLLEIAGGDPSDMLRDSSAIMRAIMEQHGSQRFRLGWSEDAIGAEMKVLLDVTCEAIRRIGGDASEETEQACAAVGQFVAQATRHTVGSYRFAAATHQLGAVRG